MKTVGGDYRMKPEGPKIEAEGRERGGFLGEGQKTHSQKVESDGFTAGRGEVVGGETQHFGWGISPERCLDKH